MAYFAPPPILSGLKEVFYTMNIKTNLCNYLFSSLPFIATKEWDKVEDDVDAHVVVSVVHLPQLLQYSLLSLYISRCCLYPGLPRLLLLVHLRSAHTVAALHASEIFQVVPANSRNLNFVQCSMANTKKDIP